MDIKNEVESSLNLDELKDALINHISTNNKAFFKHQQKDEEDLNVDDKKVILTDILANSHSKFLARFGMVLKKEHLRYFESQNYDTEQQELVKEQIKQLSYNLDHERLLIKNRRYVAMIKLINEKDYFSDIEMERRNPVLYNELVGKFISPAERAKRRRPNAQTSTLVDVLLNQIDYDETCENAKKQRELEGEDSRQSFDSNESDIESNQMQWGNLDNEEIDCSRNSKTRRKRNADILVTAGERDVLRDEFLGIMYNDFLTGRDAEFFDYTQVDKNEEYDDMSLEKDQDFEDKYFADEDSQNVSQDSSDNIITKTEESEDELDIFMQHLEEHIKKQSNDKFKEEFDDE